MEAPIRWASLLGPTPSAGPAAAAITFEAVASPGAESQPPAPKPEVKAEAEPEPVSGAPPTKGQATPTAPAGSMPSADGGTPSEGRLWREGAARPPPAAAAAEAGPPAAVAVAAHDMEGPTPSAGPSAAGGASEAAAAPVAEPKPRPTPKGPSPEPEPEPATAAPMPTRPSCRQSARLKLNAQVARELAAQQGQRVKAGEQGRPAAVPKPNAKRKATAEPTSPPKPKRKAMPPAVARVIDSKWTRSRAPKLAEKAGLLGRDFKEEGRGKEKSRSTAQSMRQTLLRELLRSLLKLLLGVDPKHAAAMVEEALKAVGAEQAAHIKCGPLPEREELVAALRALGERSRAAKRKAKRLLKLAKSWLIILMWNPGTGQGAQPVFRVWGPAKGWYLLARVLVLVHLALAAPNERIEDGDRGLKAAWPLRQLAEGEEEQESEEGAGKTSDSSSSDSEEEDEEGAGETSDSSSSDSEGEDEEGEPEEDGEGERETAVIIISDSGGGGGGVVVGKGGASMGGSSPCG
ncbi:hypothetical protein HYH03_017730 [Edaphochlamys debaryana]|uniref:Uncharacterized protein n=1 Tax=Edaphochlamys debaryana TaxID=47281 RepID=A0A835XH95_9CHLO|nr:hypothetical protein HYH03_017730 [Edaphochlamys debaryana]|eukprot:KAG2483374.1 hypothetical protein HYH03_017730 [Edaphochlamys debaryana]